MAEYMRELWCAEPGTGLWGFLSSAEVHAAFALPAAAAAAITELAGRKTLRWRWEQQQVLVAAQAQGRADARDCERAQQLATIGGGAGGVAAAGEAAPQLAFEHELLLTWRQETREVAGPSGHVWFTLRATG
jgi:hypothetical protein